MGLKFDHSDTNPDVIVIGAGAAGLFAAIETARRGRKTLVLDHAKKPAEKIRISGGGRCNFTNVETEPKRFLSENPHFAKSALARYTPWDFMDRMAAHGLTWHEKTLGQLFCDQKSGAVIQFLLDDLAAAGGELHLQTPVKAITKPDDRFNVSTEHGDLTCASLIIATGGLSIPKIGATGFGYDIARQFGHDIIETRPALVPFTLSGDLKDQFAALSGVSTPVSMRAKAGPAFTEGLLLTHRGVSGPAALQVSSYWCPGEAIDVDFSPETSLKDRLDEARRDESRLPVQEWLSRFLPNRLAEMFVKDLDLEGQRLANLSNAVSDEFISHLTHYELRPVGTEGYRTAEVTVGGVNTDGLSSKTMESKHCLGLYFIGEVVDVTGWLGGYNFQWAWASAWAAGQVA